MSAKMNHEELVELLQEGKIGFLRFVMDSENADDYLEWCRSHGTDPSDESAEFYVEQTENRPSSMWNRRTSSRWTVR